MSYTLLAAATLLIGAIFFVLAHYSGRYDFFAVTGSAIVYWLHSLRYLRYTSDDSYISYRYAEHLAEGAGLVWNRGQHVEGYTNFLWVVILGGLNKLGADIVFSGRWLGFGLGIAAIAGTYILSRRLVSGRAGQIAGFIAAFLLAASGPFATWSTAGLETSLFAVLLLCAVLAHIREQRGDALPLSGALWALLMMTHPAGAAPFGVSAVFKCGEAAPRIRSAGGDRSTARGREMRTLGIWFASFAVLYVPYFAWRFATYGWLFPNTYYAKVGSGLSQYARGLFYTNRFTEEYALWILLAAPVALLAGAIERRRSAYLLAVISATVVYIVAVGGDGLLGFRFFAPLLPLVYALSIGSAAAIARGLVADAEPQPWLRPAAIAALAAALVLFTLQASQDDVAVRAERVTVAERVEIGRWMRANLPSETVVAVVPAGSIPYESRLPSIDMLGLNDEHIAHRRLDLPGVIIGHEKYDSAYVLDQKPAVIILNDHLTRSPWRLADYDVLRGQIILAIPDMLASPRLQQEYEPRSVQIAANAWFNLFVRRDAAPVLSQTEPPPEAADVR